MDVLGYLKDYYVVCAIMLVSMVPASLAPQLATSTKHGMIAMIVVYVLCVTLGIWWLL